jgi:hypothetical protein
MLISYLETKMTRKKGKSRQHASTPIVVDVVQSNHFFPTRNPAQRTTLRMLAVGVLACASATILH